MAGGSGSRGKALHSYKRIQADLKEGRLKNILMFYGRENYLIRWACDQIRQRYVVPAVEMFDFVRIDGTETPVGEIIAACETLPMMSEKKVVLVNSFSEAAGRGEELSEYLKDFSPDTVLILICDTPDKRRKLYKAVTKYGEAYEFDRLDKPLLRSFLSKRFRASKKQFDPDLPNYFIEVCGYYDRDSEYTIDNLVNDVSKVVAHSGDRILASDIEDVVVSDLERNVFAFTDALADGQKGEALRILHFLLEGSQSVFPLLGLICSQYETILAVKEMRSDGMDQREIKKILGIHEYRIEKAMRAGTKYSAGQLRGILKKAYEVDRQIKTGVSEQEMALEMFVGSI